MRRVLRKTASASRKATRDELIRYFVDPPDRENKPEAYLNAPSRSEYLLELVDRIALPPSARILEVGCNAGRNLLALRRKGFSAVTGVELSEKAVNLARTYSLEVTHDLLERFLPNCRDAYDLVFSMAVLEHVPPESAAGIFPHMSRIGKAVLTIEDEREDTWNHFPRNYGKVFKALGMTQRWSERAPRGIGLDGFRARFFVH